MHIGLISFLIELCLAVHRIGTGHPTDIVTVRLLYTGIAVIGQHRIKNVLQACFQSRSRDRAAISTRRRVERVIQSAEPM